MSKFLAYRNTKVVSSGQQDILLLKASNHLSTTVDRVHSHAQSLPDIRDPDYDRVGRVLVVPETPSKRVSVRDRVGGEGLATVVHNAIDDRVASL